MTKHLSVFYKYATLLLFYTLSVLYCFAGDTIPTPNQYEIDEVVIVINTTKKEIIPTQSLEGEKLKKLSVNSVADAVRYFSGVQIKDYGGIGGLKTINIRSLGSNHVGVFYDGIELGNAQNGVVDLGRFSLDNMEAVTLYNGQKSAIFQSAKDFASASSIYMKTRTPSFEDNKKYNLNIGLKGGSFKTINPTLLWEQRISKNISSSFSGEYMYTSGEYKFSYTKKDGYDTTAIRQNGDVQSFRLEGGLFGKMDKGEWNAKLYYYQSGRGYPGAFIREIPGKFKNEDRQWDRNFFAQSSIKMEVYPWYSFKINGKYAYDYLHYLSDPRLDISTMYVNNTYKQQEAYVSLANLFSMFHWWSASISTDFQYNTLDADLINFVFPQRFNVLTSIATSFDFQNFKFQASLLHTYVYDQTKTAGASASDKNIFSPAAIASYQPFKNIDLNVRAFYKRMFRIPTLNDLYYTFIGNVKLKPEYTNQYNLGVSYNKTFFDIWLQRIEIQSDIYYNEIEDKIISMPTSNQFRWTMINLGYVEIRGVDALIHLDWKINKFGISTRFNYTYQQAQDFTDPNSEYYGGQVPYIPWHNGTIIIGMDYRGWHLNYSFIYTGERYEATANILENYAQPWYTHDLSLSKNLDFKHWGLRLTAEVNNIFNQQYEVVQCYPMPGTNFKLKINVIL